VLVYAHRGGGEQEEAIARWLRDAVGGPAAYGLSDLVLSGFLRVVTHPRVFESPTPLPKALDFVRRLRDRPNRVEIVPGPRHWSVFESLCDTVKATGNRVPDAYLAALAIESGSEWITTDRGFARFSGLRWRHPLEGP
jgi:toxin-antitoxin system PIN domain toxin